MQKKPQNTRIALIIREPQNTPNTPKCLADVGHGADSFIIRIESLEKKHQDVLRLLGGCSCHCVEPFLMHNL